jgi:hypothetical protein
MGRQTGHPSLKLELARGLPAAACVPVGKCSGPDLGWVRDDDDDVDVAPRHIADLFPGDGGVAAAAVTTVGGGGGR